MGSYFHSGTRRASVLLGVMVMLLSYLLLTLLQLPRAGVYALLLGAGVTLLASLLFPFRTFLRYRGIEKSLPAPVLFKTDVGIKDDDTLRGGYLYLTKDVLYLFSRDRKPFASRTLTKESVRGVIVERSVYMTVKLANAARCLFTSARCEELLDMMREHGWEVD